MSLDNKTGRVTVSAVIQTNLLAPIEIWEVPLDEKSVIKFSPALILQPVPILDTLTEEDLCDEEIEESGYVVINRPDLNIAIHDNTAEGLRSAVEWDIHFVWTNFVQRDDSALDKELQQVKRNYLAIAEVVDA
jgi:hypothetical protein